MKSSYNLRVAEANIKVKESEEAIQALRAKEEQMVEKELQINSISTQLKKSSEQLKAQQQDNKTLAAEILALRQERDNAVAQASLATANSSGKYILYIHIGRERET